MMVVSRSWEINPGNPGPSKDSSALKSEGKGAFPVPKVVVFACGWEEVRVLVMIVRERRGILSFFVRRIEDEEAVSAERRARWSEARDTRRLIVLFSIADWIT